MKITLAIIAYNAEKHIGLCLDSCINQRYKDLDIVVVDDNSSDRTTDIVKEYQNKDKRINLVVHAENKSALQARKTAVKHAKSDYVWFIDSDDRIENFGAVAAIAKCIKQENHPDMVCFGSNDYYENGKLKREFYDWGRKREIPDWKFDSDFRPYTRITKKKVLEKAINVIPDDFYLYRHNDLFMFCLVKLCTNKKVFLNKALYRYTLSSSSVTNQKDKASISKHIGLFTPLLNEYRKSANKIEQTDVDIDAFILKEKSKLIKYAIQQYQGNPENYLHTLKELNNYDKKIIISLTTYSSRIHTVNKVVESLLKQTILVDKIILWLDEDEFIMASLPVQLTDLLSDVFEIKFCQNFKSYKKIIPTLELYPEATIITFDDDINYPDNQVEKLLLAHFKNPIDIIANVARNITIKGGKLQPYKTWSHTSQDQTGRARTHFLPIGVGGVLYPQGSLSNEVMNAEQFLKLAPHGDDLWLKCMSLLNGRKVVPTGAGYDLLPRQIDGTKEIGLWQQVNKNTDSNFEQLTNICNAYNAVKDILLSTHKNVEVQSSYLYSIEPLIPNYLDSNDSNYSPFKLANKLFNSKKFYEAASIYSYLAELTPDFKYYKINYDLAVTKFEQEYGKGKAKIRWDKNISKEEYDLAAIDIIFNNDKNLSNKFFKTELEKLKNLPDSHLLLASSQILNKNKWQMSVNNWLNEYGLDSLPFSEINPNNIFKSLVTSPKKVSKGSLVTIFLSAYNAEDTITYAVESLLNQTYENLEIIIVDDCSTDDTNICLQKLANSDARIKVYTNTVNRGTYFNRNYGLKIAKGKYFTVMDADDYALQNRIEIQVDTLEKNNALVGVLGNWVRVKPNGTFGCRYTWTSSYMQPAVATLLFRREKVVNRIGYFDSVRFGADTEFIERIKRILSPKSIKTLGIPLCLSASLESSLTGNKTTGIDFITGTSEVRLNYNAAWKSWHKSTAIANLKVPYNNEQRKFFAAAEMLS
jgi:glycosyltransferase involved in cell wall biosynthesis